MRSILGAIKKNHFNMNTIETLTVDQFTKVLNQLEGNKKNKTMELQELKDLIEYYGFNTIIKDNYVQVY